MHIRVCIPQIPWSTLQSLAQWKITYAYEAYDVLMKHNIIPGAPTLRVPTQGLPLYGVPGYPGTRVLGYDTRGRIVSKCLPILPRYDMII
jgi:hypothetical protein